MPPYLEHSGRSGRTLEGCAATPSLTTFVGKAGITTLLTMPMIYSLLLPLAVIDAWVTLYQWICFPVYGIARVRRRRYVAFDRHKLPYLNAIEKMNCTFCSYADGVIAYVREVAARTEQYWCPIKHARPVTGAHDRYQRFVEFSDGSEYRRQLVHLRRGLRRR